MTRKDKRTIQITSENVEGNIMKKSNEMMFSLGKSQKFNK